MTPMMYVLVASGYLLVACATFYTVARFTTVPSEGVFGLAVTWPAALSVLLILLIAWCFTEGVDELVRSIRRRNG